MSTFPNPQAQIESLDSQIIVLRQELAELQRRIRRLERHVKSHSVDGDHLLMLSEVPLTNEDR